MKNVPYTTTLAKLREADACTRGYDLIANHVGRDYTGDILLSTILEVNGREYPRQGIQDCIWAMRASEGGRELAVATAIYIVLALDIYKAGDVWYEWARNWLSDTDRTAAAANANATATAAAYSATATAAHKELLLKLLSGEYEL